MNFWVYMLICNDRTLYVGHTEDMDKRLHEHEKGLISGAYTASRRPVRLLKSWHFADREDAKRLEKQLKGWSRAKKIAFAEGGYEAVKALKRT